MNSDGVKTKRQRSNNYTAQECSTFLQLLPKYVGKISNKKTDGISLRMKEAAWQELTREFNTHSHYSQRTKKQLRNFYDNFKRRAKKRNAEEKIERFRIHPQKPSTTTLIEFQATNSILPKDSEINETSLQRIDIIKDQIHPLQNDKDSGAIYQNATRDFEAVGGMVVNEGLLPVIEEMPSTSKVTEMSFEMNCETVLEPSAQGTPVWMSRNCPIKRRETEAVKARKSITHLADEGKQLCELERQLLLEKQQQEIAYFKLKKRVQFAKMKAYEAKQNYYEEKFKKIRQ